jgi:hypothetical protein
MPARPPDYRADQIIGAPAGCVLLLIAEEHGLSPADLARPETGLYVIAEAVGTISPWRGDHDRIVTEALRHGPRLRDRALELVREPGIAAWWAPIDREYQLVLPQHDSFICPEEVWDLRPPAPPNPHERYAHRPFPGLSTSENWYGFSSELAQVISRAGDWVIDFPINRRSASIRPTARVLEIAGPHDWHELALHYAADGQHGTMPDFPGQPWGDGAGLIVPDWSAAAQDWDGVHITPWALLTATQVRIASDIGSTEPWAWEGAHTRWLNWMFDSIEDLPPVTAGMYEHPGYWSRMLLSPDTSEVE